MTATADNKLSKARLQQLLVALGSRMPDDSDQIETTEHDWYKAYYLNTGELEMLDNFGRKVSVVMSKNFNNIYNHDFEVTNIAPTQHFAREFLTTPSDASTTETYYCARFGSDEDEEFGVVKLPGQTAATLTKRLLGDKDSQEASERELSQLEQSLLMDIVRSLVEAFSEPCEDQQFQLTGELIRNQVPLELRDIEELCQIKFSAKDPESEEGCEISFLMQCGKLESIIGKTRSENEVSLEDGAETMLKHVYKAPIAVKLQLDSIKLSLRQIMSLDTNDVLLLDKAVDEPIEVLIEETVFFRGQLAKSKGDCAVVISEKCNVG